MSEFRASRFKAAQRDEQARVARIMTGVSIAALLLLGGIGIKSWYSNHHLHALTLFAFFLMVALNVTVFLRTGNLQASKVGLLCVVAGLFTYLVASGGENNTGPLWLYVFPPLVFYLTDLKIGTYLLLGCFVLTGLVFLFPDLPLVAARYERDFQIRFFATMAFSSVFCFVLELGRLNARNELVKMAASHEQAARTDALTGLANRRDMQQRLSDEMSRFERSGHHFSVALIDLDHFKRINDRFGHDAGDTILKAFANRLKSTCRQSDVAARWGGEEFLLLLPDTSLLQALTLSERLRHGVESERFVSREQPIPVTISVGVCSITQTDSVEELLRQADHNLYEAKEAGRNRICPRVRSH